MFNLCVPRSQQSEKLKIPTKSAPTLSREANNMDALDSKYKDHKDELLEVMDVSKQLLTMLTREGLLDIADCVKYQVCSA